MSTDLIWSRCVHRVMLSMAMAALALSASSALAQQAAVKLALEGKFKAPRWSPDGKSLALAGDGYKGVYVVNADGTGLRQLSDEPGAGYGLAWSPDSRRVAFRARRGESATKLLKVAAVDGSGVRVLRETDGDLSLPVWLSGETLRFAADGRTLAANTAGGAVDEGIATEASQLGHARGFDDFVTADASDDNRVVLVTAGGEKKHLTREIDGRFYDPQLSPQGDRALAHHLNSHIYLINIATGTKTDLGRGYGARWSPDGKRVLCYLAEDDTENIISSDIFIIDPGSAERTLVTRTLNRQEEFPDWSPDGKRIAYNDRLTGAVYVQTIEK